MISPSTLGSIVLALTLALACAHAPEPDASAEVVESSGELPEHLVATVRHWGDVVIRNVKTASADGRLGHKREVRWTDAERAELEATRAAALETIAEASAEDRPWLLAVYVSTFAWYGAGSEWADALLEIPPSHPVWSGRAAWALVEALEESEDPSRLRAYIHAAAAAHDAPRIQAVSTYLLLEDADRAGDWKRVQELHARFASTSDAQSLDIGRQLDPSRPLRAGTKVPHWCAPAILGPHAGEQVCLDQQFPHDGTTLIIGWATWCPPCNEQLPRVIELVRDRPIRVIAISHDDDAELARTHLREHGVEDWTVLLPRAERPHPRDEMSLDARPIPFMALVDGEGNVEAGPPWLDAEMLAERL